MIAAKFHNEETDTTTILLTLEPGNIAKLLAGEPVFKFLSEFLPTYPIRLKLAVTYTPDAAWVAEMVRQGADFQTVLQAGVDRAPIIRPTAGETEVL
jgi:hypothetical protein